MKLWVNTIALALISILAFAEGAVAGSYKDGAAAYEPGDYQTAFGIFKSLAERGDALTQARVGFMYRLGEGVPQDYAKAATWFVRAAEQGLPIAEVRLGHLYRFGERKTMPRRRGGIAARPCRALPTRRINSVVSMNGPNGAAVSSKTM